MNKRMCFALAILCLIPYYAKSEETSLGSYPPCFSDIYCHGPLLHTIQMAKIYKDSKTFVDMKMRFPRNETLDRFNLFMDKHDNYPSREQVRTFVLDTFEDAGQEFETWDPIDWIKAPKFADKIQDDNLRKWALHLNDIWKNLGRKMKVEVKENVELYSIIWIPHPVIVPGGRFREYYYWDSYWIVQGLLLSEMTQTVKGILENFLYIIDTYGHIPNGGRIYYLARSQPPLMIPMVKLYLDHTGDVEFIAKNIKSMEKEFEYWMKNHTINVHKDGKNYTLAIYGDKSYGPRPESYTEDVSGATHLTDVKKEAYYSELKAGAESGWDFSSRWFITNATNEGNLTNIKTRSIVPVDLNAFIYWNAILLAEFHEKLNNPDRVEYYTKIAKEWLEAVTVVLWHEEVGSWLDYDVLNSVKRDYFYPTNIAPLLTGCYDNANKNKVVRLVLKYLHNKHIMNNPGGIPTTMKHTGEQWDYPNAWPPLQHLMILGLNKTGDPSAQRLAFEIAQKWVRSNYKAYKASSLMYEKYDATRSGGYGGGGEYLVQDGFGWTNGIIMDLLDKYSAELRTDDEVVPSTVIQSSVVSITQTSGVSSVSTVLIALLVTLSAGFIGICIYKRRSGQFNNSFSNSNASKVKYTELRSMSRHAR